MSKNNPPKAGKNRETSVAARIFKSQKASASGQHREMGIAHKG
jgi:hypothetical protein